MNQVAPNKWKPAVIGGVVMGVLSAIPVISFLNCACCCLVIGGGVFASYLYRKDLSPGAPRPTLGDGALIGVMAGVVGAVAETLVSIPISLIGIGAAQMEGTLEALRNNPDIPPEVLRFLDTLLAGGIAGVGLLIGFLVSLVIFSIFGALGGILGMAIFEKGSTQKGGGTPPPVAPAGGSPSAPPPPAAPESPPPAPPPSRDDPGASGN